MRPAPGRKCRGIAVVWAVNALLCAVVLRCVGARWGLGLLIGACTGAGVAVWVLVDDCVARRHREEPEVGPDLVAVTAPPPGITHPRGTDAAGAADVPEHSGSLRWDVWWKGRLGRTPCSLVRADGRDLLTIGGWETVVGPTTAVRHKQHVLWMTLTVEQTGKDRFTHRYRLRWALQLAPFWETTYDDISAEADDDGLVLARFLGGTTDWHQETAARSSGV